MFPNEYYPYDKYEVQQNFVIGIPLSRPFRNLLPISKDSCIVDAYDSIMTYTISNRQFGSKIKNPYIGYLGDVRVSSKGKYLTSAMGLYNSNFFWTSTNSIENYSMMTILNQGISSVSDNGLMVQFNRNEYRLSVYDITNSQQLATLTDEALFSDDIKMSSNGDYILMNGNGLLLFKYQNNQLTQVQKTSDFRYFEFNSTDANQYVTWNGSKIFVKQLPDNTIVREFAMTDSDLCSIDFYNNEILTYSNGHLYVRSLIDGSILFDLPSKADDAFIDRDCYLQNHRIFHDFGVIFNVTTK
jgi:hypothetical protein